MRQAASPLTLLALALCLGAPRLSAEALDLKVLGARTVRKKAAVAVAPGPLQLGSPATLVTADGATARPSVRIGDFLPVIDPTSGAVLQKGAPALPLAKANPADYEDYTPAVGEHYQVLVTYSVAGTPSADLGIRVGIPGFSVDVDDPAPGPGTFSVLVDLGRLPADGALPVTVALDPDQQQPEAAALRGDDTFHFGFTPRPVGTGVTYLEPTTYSLIQRTKITPPAGWKASSIPGGSVDFMAAVPSSEGHLRITGATFGHLFKGGQYVKTLNAVTSYPTFQKVYRENLIDDLQAGVTTQVDNYFELAASNIISNRDALAQVTWDQVDALQGLNIFKTYTQPDSVVEYGPIQANGRTAINNFVFAKLPSNYRTALTPYETARRLFIATANWLTYTYPSPSATASEAYLNKKGDCGAYSLLFVAALRKVGIPARTACGFWVTELGAADKFYGHCVAEFYLPGHGWIVADPTAMGCIYKNPSVAYFFGINFSTNALIPIQRGNKFCTNPDFSGHVATWLQGPDILPWVNTAATSNLTLTKQ